MPDVDKTLILYKASRGLQLSRGECPGLKSFDNATISIADKTFTVNWKEPDGKIRSFSADPPNSGLLPPQSLQSHSGTLWYIDDPPQEGDINEYEIAQLASREGQSAGVITVDFFDQFCFSAVFTSNGTRGAFGTGEWR